ncbi:hypothetical protein I9W82_005279 [Candida metapsilosis]|uniref:Uncharacterized protein n=1 Tax=Candida metapsilosis TaxID=273372 RepID=A0A8H7Z9B8_9ASCO|nr:hypothetical protein I9W82_005279 [Candida metapsilosis]
MSDLGRRDIHDKAKSKIKPDSQKTLFEQTKDKIANAADDLAGKGTSELRILTIKISTKPDVLCLGPCHGLKQLDLSDIKIQAPKSVPWTNLGLLKAYPENI